MRNVILSMFMSIDGYVEGEGGEFIAPAWSDDLDRWTAELMEFADTLCFGRVAWQGMTDYWVDAEVTPRSDAEARLASYMNATRKVVFSRSLSDAGAWRNSELAPGDVVETFARLRAEPGRDIAVLAGAKLVRSCLRAGVLDELRLLIVPQLYGAGTRLFDAHYDRADFTLRAARTLDTGAVLLHYARRGR